MLRLRYSIWALTRGLIFLPHTDRSGSRDLEIGLGVDVKERIPCGRRKINLTHTDCDGEPGQDQSGDQRRSRWLASQSAVRERPTCDSRIDASQPSTELSPFVRFAR
jgi:hypothetical protein